MANHLAGESSPYLLQHAHNPVDWYPWGAEAMEKAKEEDKPILISIGYSACHWCHVMERESFEDPAVAEIMNAYFINIKIDREERPDLDHIYMDAVQAMTGSGGWPLNVFLTPETKPFYGGTYFPPSRAYNRPSWREILLAIHENFSNKRPEINAQSDYLVQHLLNANTAVKKHVEISAFSRENISSMAENILKTADQQEGGFGHAPKFPQTCVIQALLRDFYLTKNESSLRQACLSLDKMIDGGIHDHLAGGFARYATDEEWLVPHFEKMLYDNALLVTVISEAYQLTGRKNYRDTVAKTLEFVSRELLSTEGGFYAAMDADSEGVEGKYYVWDKKEIDELLKKDALLFCDYYDITESGNWEEKNILHVKEDLASFAHSRNRDIAELEEFLACCRYKVLEKRNSRIKPLLDDKVILGWNALMVTAYCKAYAAIGEESYKMTAIRTMDFIYKNFKGEGIFNFYHSFKEGKARFPAFLDDYAFLISALIQLQEVTGDANYLLKAKDICSYVISYFGNKSGGLFYFTHIDQNDVIIRKKEMYDGALPSGNSVMAHNLYCLGTVFDEPEWKLLAIKNCEEMSGMIFSYPGSFANWATLLQGMTYGMNEVVITGLEPGEIRKDFLSRFVPFRVFQSAGSSNDLFPLLRNKPISDPPLIFLCRDYSCQTPVKEVDELIPLLENVYKYKNN